MSCAVARTAPVGGRRRMTASPAAVPSGVTTYVRFDMPAVMSSTDADRHFSSPRAAARYGPTTAGSAPTGDGTAAGAPLALRSPPVETRPLTAADDDSSGVGHKTGPVGVGGLPVHESGA